MILPESAKSDLGTLAICGASFRGASTIELVLNALRVGQDFFVRRRTRQSSRYEDIPRVTAASTSCPRFLVLLARIDTPDNGRVIRDDLRHLPVPEFVDYRT